MRHLAHLKEDMSDPIPHITAFILLLIAGAERGEAVGAVVVFGTGIIVGALLIIVADAYARRKHGR